MKPSELHQANKPLGGIVWTKWSTEAMVAGMIFFAGAALYIIHFLFFRHSFPPSNLDEASFFSPAYSLANKGRLSSDLHATFLPGASQYTYWMPPLYMVLLSGVLKAFGSTVLNAKLFSFFLLLSGAALLSLLVKNRYAKLILVGIFLCCPFILISSSFIRMEALGVLLIIISILAVKNNASPLGLGILAGLGAMTHPLVIPCSVALALIHLQRGMKPLLLFSAAALLTASPYLLYILQDFTIFQDQMAAQMARKLDKKLRTVKMEYVLQTVPSVVLALFLLYRSRVNKELRVFLTTALVLSVLIIIKSMEFNYHVYAIPYVLAILGLSMEAMKGKRLYRFYIPILFCIFFLTLLLAKASNFNYQDDASYHQLTRYLSAQPQWKGKKIYVTGDPDVSIYLLMHNQMVERKNAVAAVEKPGWFNQFNCVISLVDKRDKANSQAGQAWSQWNLVDRFTTSDSVYSLLTFMPKQPGEAP